MGWNQPDHVIIIIIVGSTIITSDVMITKW